MHIEFLELFLLAPAQEASAGKCESASAEHEDADEKTRSTIVSVCVEPLLLPATASSSASWNASTFSWWEANSGRSRLVLTRTRNPLITLQHSYFDSLHVSPGISEEIWLDLRSPPLMCAVKAIFILSSSPMFNSVGNRTGLLDLICDGNGKKMSTKCNVFKLLKLPLTRTWPK